MQTCPECGGWGEWVNHWGVVCCWHCGGSGLIHDITGFRNRIRFVRHYWRPGLPVWPAVRFMVWETW